MQTATMFYLKKRKGAKKGHNLSRECICQPVLITSGNNTRPQSSNKGPTIVLNALKELLVPQIVWENNTHFWQEETITGSALFMVLNYKSKMDE